MVVFPLKELLNPRACYELLVSLLHPRGFCCPNGHSLEHAYVHKQDRPTIPDYRCKQCGRCFNVFTGTVLHGTKYNAVKVIQLLRGIVEGTPTAKLAREMGVDRKALLIRRHQLQGLAAKLKREPLPDATAEADEMYQNSGEKRAKARRPGRSAAASRQQGSRSRHVGQRSAAGLRRRRS